jgi:hypothetical protein
MRFERLSRAVRAVEYQGLELPVTPDGQIPELPEELTEIGDAELMRLLAQYTVWGEYAASIVVRYAIEEEHLAAVLDRERASCALRHQDHKSVTAQKAAVAADPAVHDLEDDHQGARAKRKFAEVVMNGTERKASVISRELTRRVGRHDREARTSRWNP